MPPNDKSVVPEPDTTVQLHDPPKEGSAVSRALPAAAAAGASAGVTAAKTIIESGGMGLHGIWKVVANMTAIGFVCGMFFLIFQNWTQTQKAMLDYERVERQKDREERSRDRDAANAELRSLTNEIRTDRAENRQLISELRQLIQTVRFTATGKKE